MAPKNLRTYGTPPFDVAVVHGGPGAAGKMAPVARELSSTWGVLEPLQTAASLQGQVEELTGILEAKAARPVTLVGFSWGAWLSWIVASQFKTVSKLILVGSASYEEKCAARIDDTRSSRLDETDRTKVASLMIILNNPAAKNKDLAFAQLGRILEKADAYDPILDEPHSIQCRFGIFQSVWKAAQELRRSGTLLELGKNIECPVVALHGDHDPHPAEGVEKPLSAVLKNFRFILLRNCGHKPWIERQAADKFYEILREELRSKG